MTFREKTDHAIDRWRKLQKQALWCMGIAMVVNIGWGIFIIFFFIQRKAISQTWECLVGAFAVLALYFIAIQLGRANYSAWTKVRCPHCDRKLSYLLFDPSYSKWFFTLLWLPHLPGAVKLCPYCRFDFDAENGAE